jgi:hypothetical protein
MFLCQKPQLLVAYAAVAAATALADTDLASSSNSRGIIADLVTRACGSFAGYDPGVSGQNRIKLIGATRTRRARS